MKKIKFAWKRFLFWIGATALTVMTAACATKAAVMEPAMQLDMVQMVETAVQATEETGDALRQRLGAPERFAAELVSPKGYLKVHADAAVFVPAAELPVIRVSNRMFTQDEVRRYADALMGADAKYIGFDGEERLPAGYWRRKADTLRYAIEHWEAYGELKYDLQFYTIEEARVGLAKWEEYARNAPASLPAATPDFTWEHATVSDASGTRVAPEIGYIHLFAMPDDATVSNLYVTNNAYAAPYAWLYYSRDMQKGHGVMDWRTVDVSDKLVITRQEAYALAGELVAKLGIEDLVCIYEDGMESDNHDFFAHQFVFARQVNGAPTTFVNQSGDLENERIRIVVDDHGILSFRHDIPYQITETVTDQAALLPFSDIRSVFEKMILIVNNQTEMGEIWNKREDARLRVDYFITDVRLGLAYVPESGNDGKGMLVPAWDFLGYEQSQVNDRPVETIGTNRCISFLTINAVDGTVIDRRRGY